MASHQILSIEKLLLLGLFVLLGCSGCVTYIGYDGPYEGRVIDKDTRRPIEGAVVHGTWVKSHPGPGGASSSYYDAKETLTDKGGNFKIDGVGVLFLSNMEEMEVNVFKAGYSQWQGYWSSSKRCKDCADIAEWEGNKEIFKLRRMTLEERDGRIVDTPNIPGKSRKLFLLEENRERLEIGKPLLRME